MNGTAPSEIIKTIPVPTGVILLTAGSKGTLECLSIGDYGKEKNLHAEFLGLHKEINGVEHCPIMPLSKKWVITISTQYGCSMGCTFCDVPKVGPGTNASFSDLIGQVRAAMSIYPEVKSTERLNLHYARMGEPTWNPYVLSATKWLVSRLPTQYKLHPVISTMMPKNNAWIEPFLSTWMTIKNEWLAGEAGLQISINSTNEDDRHIMFGGNAMTLQDIYKTMSNVALPKGRKIALNFALSKYEINERELLKWFDPAHYMCKITPMHETRACVSNDMLTVDGYKYYYPYKETECRLIDAGYDVIVFIPSEEEDKSKITCGNAILAER